LRNSDANSVNLKKVLTFLNLALVYHISKNSKFLQNHAIRLPAKKQKGNIVKKSVLTAFLLIMVYALYAQGSQKNDINSKISGKVIDSISKLHVEYATITLFAKGDKNPLNGTTTNNLGYFEIQGVPAGAFTIVVEFIGYKPFTIQNILVNKKNVIADLKTIALGRLPATLQNVTVTSTGRLIENKIDKMIFNAEKDLTSQTGVATDVLKKIPQVSVDADGNVELSGSSGIRFLINGKPSSAFGSSISDVLQSIPASQIKSIEVITNPGAKYDAQGLGGIINIILKKSTAQGINGNISLTGGTRMENGSFNFNARKGKIAVNAFFSGNARLKANTPSNSDRLSRDTTAKNNISFLQDGVSRFTRNGFQTGVGLDYTINSKNSISGSLAYNHFGNSGSGFTNQSQRTIADNGSGNIISDILSVNNTANTFNFHNIDASINYKKTFAREDQELDVAVNSSTGTSHNTASNNQFTFPESVLYYGTNSNNPGRQKETEIQIDYTQPLKKNVLLGIGSKMSTMDINSNSNVLKLNGVLQNFLQDPFLSNYLNYHQKVYAFYSELTFPVSDLFNAKIGGRYERTEINSFYSDAQHQQSEPGYNTFVPSVFLSRKLGDDATIKLSYSKRIERPDYGDLNPFINTSDPKNISAGNPYLLPEIGQRFELGYNRDFGKTGSFMVSLFYRINNHDIQPYIVYYPSYTVGDTTYTNTAVSMRQNIGIEKNAGVNLFGDLHITSKFNIRSNLFFFQRHTINVLDPGYNSNSFNYRLNLNATYQFSGTLAAEFFGNFNSARHEAQGKYPSFTSYSIAIRKQFWKKNVSLALTATNPFKEYIDQRTEVFGPNFTVNALRQIPFRSVGLNFTWKFGKLEFKKAKEENDNINAPAE